jgi:hypothetical protein
MTRPSKANANSARYSLIIREGDWEGGYCRRRLRLKYTSIASLQVTSGVMVIGVLSSRSAILFLVHQALIKARGVVWR